MQWRRGSSREERMCCRVRVRVRLRVRVRGRVRVS